jgi:hypothetical protein
MQAIQQLFVRLLGLAAYLGAALWYFRAEFGRAWVYDLIFRWMESEELSKLIAENALPMALILIGSYLFWLTRPQLVDGTASSWRLPSILGEISPFDRTISLRDAAIKLYEELRGADMGRLFEKHKGASHDEILDGVAHHILEHVALEVKRPPSTKWERLPDSEKSNLMSRNGARGIGTVMGNEVTYTEPRLKRRDLTRVIRDYKAEARP